MISGIDRKRKFQAENSVNKRYAPEKKQYLKQSQIFQISTPSGHVPPTTEALLS
jgi:hypothetical protein